MRDREGKEREREIKGKRRKKGSGRGGGYRLMEGVGAVVRGRQLNAVFRTGT